MNYTFWNYLSLAGAIMMSMLAGIDIANRNVVGFTIDALFVAMNIYFFLVTPDKKVLDADKK